MDLLVDPVDDLQVSRKELLEQADFPLLECFGQHSVTKLAVLSDGLTWCKQRPW
jgi:hypothetical protein